MKKLRKNRGETLVETLAALLIAVLVLLFLASAIVGAARLNAAIQKTDVSFHYTGAVLQPDPVELEISDGFTTETVTADEYVDPNGYHNYTKP